jgi:hypothetical protein
MEADRRGEERMPILSAMDVGTTGEIARRQETMFCRANLTRDIHRARPEGSKASLRWQREDDADCNREQQDAKGRSHLVVVELP